MGVRTRNNARAEARKRRQFRELEASFEKERQKAEIQVEVHLKLIEDHTPEDVPELITYLREMVCVHPDSGIRQMPTAVDDAAFEFAAKTLEDVQAAFAEIERLRLATDEGTVAKRADRMWEIACEMQGRPVPGAARLGHRRAK